MRYLRQAGVRVAQKFRDTHLLRITQAGCYGEGMAATQAPGFTPARRRDLQKEQTRLDLALAAFELARVRGLAGVRVPEIAAAVGVSTRTFNNYFPSKEAAIVWPTALRAARLAGNVAARPPAEPLPEALAAAIAGLYGDTGMEGLPAGWLREFPRLVAAEPALHGEYLKAASAAEATLAGAIAARTGTPAGTLEVLVLAAVAIAAERAAILFRARQASPAPLADVVRTSVDMAVRGIADRF
jgi:AcrR family transcriptional regulator